jgi:uncharacterized protein YoxC
MGVVKIVFLSVATVCVPLVSLFLIRLATKVGRGLDHVNRTLDDVRPQLNITLLGLNQALDAVNRELAKVEEITEETRHMLHKVEVSLERVEKTLSSPLAKYGGMAAAFFTGRRVLRILFRDTGARRG